MILEMTTVERDSEHTYSWPGYLKGSCCVSASLNLELHPRALARRAIVGHHGPVGRADRQVPAVDGVFVVGYLLVVYYKSLGQPGMNGVEVLGRSLCSGGVSLAFPKSDRDVSETPV